MTTITAKAYLKDIKQVISELKDKGLERDEIHEIIRRLDNGETDIHLDSEVRLIHDDYILEVLAEELQSDTYLLGSFNANFLSKVTGWPQAIIEAAQKGEAYSELGEAIIQGNFIGELAESYASIDGYGHHFNRWDASSSEIKLFGDTWHLFIMKAH